MARITIGRRQVELSNPDKLLFPDAGVSKQDLVDYYLSVAPVMLPHLRDRPLSIQRFPDGVGEEGFYQKRPSDHFPDWVPTATVDSADGPLEQVMCDKRATLAYLVGQGTITLHRWLSKVDRLDHPDLLVFDLDPPDEDFESVRAAAFDVRSVLDELRLPSFVQITGSKGVHVVVPIRHGPTFDEARAFAREVAELVATRHPDRLTTEWRIEAREGRLLIDTMRNAYGQTAVAPYAVRALPGAPVATPLEWRELRDADLGARSFDVGSIPDRIDTLGDPWRAMGRRARSLDAASERLQRARESASN